MGYLFFCPAPKLYLYLHPRYLVQFGASVYVLKFLIVTSGQIYHDMPEQFPCHNLTLDLNTKNEATDDFSKHVELLVRVCINSVWSKMGIYGIPLFFLLKSTVSPQIGRIRIVRFHYSAVLF